MRGKEPVRFNRDYKTISEFSSWGVPGDLTLKPEIAAPGGNIYSLNGLHNSTSGMQGGHQDYELMERHLDGCAADRRYRRTGQAVH